MRIYIYCLIIGFWFTLSIHKEPLVAKMESRKLLTIRESPQRISPLALMAILENNGGIGALVHRFRLPQLEGRLPAMPAAKGTNSDRHPARQDSLFNNSLPWGHSAHYRSRIVSVRPAAFEQHACP